MIISKLTSRRNGQRSLALLSIFVEKRMSHLFAVILFFSACSNEKLSYTTQEAKVTKQDLTQIVTVAGKLQAARIAQIMPPYEGYIRKIYVEVGQLVKKGEPVISVSTNLDESSGYYPMRSPFAGKVTQVAAKEGQYVVGKSSQAKTLVQIEDVSRFELEVEVPELDLPKLAIGQPAKVKLASMPGKEIPASVRSIALSPKEVENRRWGDDSQSRYRVSIELKEDSPDFRTGLSATVDIQSAAKKSVLALAGEYLTEYEGSEAVKLKDGSFKKIKVGLRTESSFEILEGLKEGDTVVMDEFGQAR